MDKHIVEQIQAARENIFVAQSIIDIIGRCEPQQDAADVNIINYQILRILVVNNWHDSWKYKIHTFGSVERNPREQT